MNDNAESSIWATGQLSDLLIVVTLIKINN